MTVAGVAGVLVLGLAAPALAHVQVSADKTTAGAENVTLTFNGEAESDSAGIKSERVVLPAGIDPAGVTLVKAPAGWTFSRAADGFTVGGAPLKVGVDSVWKVKIAKLPAGETRLSFKTLETYSDGDVDRWIEIQEPGQDEPEHPAPLLTLKPGPAEATEPSATATTDATGTPSAAPSTPATTPVAEIPGDDDSGNTWLFYVLPIAVLLVLAGVFILVRRAVSKGARGDS